MKIDSTSRMTGGTLAGVCRTFSLYLSTFLAVWIALLPLIKVGHLLFSDHGHRFCAAHHLVEDVPLAAGHDEHRSTQTVAMLSSARVAAQSLSHTACAILNHSGTRDSATDARVFTGGGDEVHSSPPLEYCGTIFSHKSLLGIAPKTSPPAAA